MHLFLENSATSAALTQIYEKTRESCEGEPHDVLTLNTTS
jgi:hypothetical protein